VIIWAHTGISRRVTQSQHIRIVEEMLRDNPNLYYDISWVIFDDYINESEETLKAWADLLMRYPDRFMVGSDKVGHWNGYEGEIWKYESLLDLLDEETLLKVTQTNILTLIHVDPATMQREEVLEPAA
jgi:predicted TIM-barrel fold metal-dependent hydrolase